MASDVVRTILDHAFFTEYLIPDWGGLYRYSLVSRVWSWHAQALLFAHVILETDKQLQSFLSATNRKSERGSRLGDAVRILRITLSSGGITDVFLCEALNRCPLLYELRLSLVQIEELSLQAVEQLPSTPPITALRIQCEGGIAPFQLIEIWPSVSFLILKVKEIGDIVSRAMDRPPPFSLTELRWEGRHPPPTNLLLWLLNRSKETIKILHLAQMPWELGALLERHGPRLLSLRVPTPTASDLLRCSHLKELSIQVSNKPSVELIGALPASLEHLAVSLRGESTDGFKYLLSTAKPLLHQLKSISCYHAINLRHQLAELQKEHPFSGIDLMCYEDRSLFFGNQEDLIPTNEFPRDPAVLNFAVMDHEVFSRSGIQAANSSQRWAATLRRTKESIKRDVYILPRPSLAVDRPSTVISLDDPDSLEHASDGTSTGGTWKSAKKWWQKRSRSSQRH